MPYLDYKQRTTDAPPPRYKLADPNFPTDTEIREAVTAYVEREHHNEWPEDDWFDLSDFWETNVWIEDDKKKATVYPSKGTFFKEDDLGITFWFN